MKTLLSSIILATSLAASAQISPPNYTGLRDVTLAWDDADGWSEEVSFKLYVGVERDVFNWVVAVPTGARQWTVQVPAYDEVRFVLTAVDRGLESPPSNVVELAPFPRPPEPPLRFRVLTQTAVTTVTTILHTTGE